LNRGAWLRKISDRIYLSKSKCSGEVRWGEYNMWARISFAEASCSRSPSLKLRRSSWTYLPSNRLFLHAKPEPLFQIFLQVDRSFFFLHCNSKWLSWMADEIPYYNFTFIMIFQTLSQISWIAT
jgi:hypothetical protein